MGNKSGPGAIDLSLTSKSLSAVTFIWGYTDLARNVGDLYPPLPQKPSNLHLHTSVEVEAEEKIPNLAH